MSILSQTYTASSESVWLASRLCAALAVWALSCQAGAFGAKYSGGRKASHHSWRCECAGITLFSYPISYVVPGVTSIYISQVRFWPSGWDKRSSFRHSHTALSMLINVSLSWPYKCNFFYLPVGWSKKLNRFSQPHNWGGWGNPPHFVIIFWHLPFVFTLNNI